MKSFFPPQPYIHELSFDREQFINIVKKYSYHVDEVDWDRFEAEIALTQKISLQEINRLLKLVDKHSFAEIHTEDFKYCGNAPEIHTKEIDKDSGYLNLPGFYTQNESVYKTNYQDIVAALQKLSSKKKLILDLSGNSGGNMYPWVASLAPLYDQRTVGYFEYKYKSEKDSWNIEVDGVYCGKKKWFDEVNANKDLFEKIAVLVSSKTASSGEAVAMSFKGQSNAKLFGQKTAGFTTGNEDYQIGDYTLWLSTCIMQDRKGFSDMNGVMPDVVSDDSLKSALEWLNNDKPHVKEIQE